MRNRFYELMMYVVLAIVIIFLGMAFIGCAVPQPPLPDPGSKLLTRIIIQNNWLLTLSILGVGAGFFAFLNGNSKGISIMATCFVVMNVILMIAKFAVWLGVITLIGAIALVAYTVLVRNRAFKEVVAGVQIFKDNESEPDAVRHLKGVLDKQTKQTKKLVEKVKDKINGDS